jgi:hypothetical protein
VATSNIKLWGVCKFQIKTILPQKRGSKASSSLPLEQLLRGTLFKDVWCCGCRWGYVKTWFYSIWLDINHTFYIYGFHQKLRLNLSFWKAIFICFWKHSLSPSPIKIKKKKTIGKKISKQPTNLKILPTIANHLWDLSLSSHSQIFPALLFLSVLFYHLDILLTCLLLFLWV